MIVIENSLSIVRVIEGNIYSTGNHRTWGSINCNFPFHPSIESRLPFFFARHSPSFFHVCPWRWEIHSFWICRLYTQYHYMWVIYPISLDLGVMALLPLYPRKTRQIWQKPLLVGQAWSTPPNFTVGLLQTGERGKRRRHFSSRIPLVPPNVTNVIGGRTLTLTNMKMP